MLFHSLDYAALLIVVWIVAWGALRTRLRLRHLTLLAASYLFYCAWDWRFAGLLVFSTVLDFAMGRAIHEAASLRRKRQFLVISLVGNLGVLGFFKYYNFFLGSLNQLLSGFGVSALPGYVEVILPLGISFYTFQTLSYSLDIYYGKLKPTRSLSDFALFVAFFPQLIAGPIVRARQFLPQLERPAEFDSEKMLSGIYRILKGLVKKVFIADLIGLHLVDPVFRSPGDFGAVDAGLAMLGFYMQLGFDFSAYADMAIGSARILGFELPENFRAAARAVNLGEFWRRWHITLFTWVRDYFFIPMTVGKGSSFRPYISIFLTMTLIGLWHGAAWTFVIFGLFHGVGLALTRWWGRRRRGRSAPDRPAPVEFALTWGSRFGTILLVAASIVVFRADNLDVALQIYGLMLSPAQWVASNQLARLGSVVLVLATVLHLTTFRFRQQIETVFVSLPSPLQGALVVSALALVKMSLTVQRPFVYFQF